MPGLSSVLKQKTQQSVQRWQKGLGCASLTNCCLLSTTTVDDNLFVKRQGRTMSDDKDIATEVTNFGGKRQSACEFGASSVKGDATSPCAAEDDATDGTMRSIAQA